jgi:cell division septation protein DedD
LCDSYPVKHSAGLTDPGDVSDRLYRAVLGPAPQDRLLQRWQARNAGASARPHWRWGAFVSALAWLAWQGLFGMAALWAATATLGSVLVLGGARLAYGVGPTGLAGLWLGLVALSSVAWGLGADTLHQAWCRRRILQAVGAQPSIADACASLQARRATRGQRWVGLWLASLLALSGPGLLLQTLRPFGTGQPAGMASHTHTPSAVPLPAKSVIAAVPAARPMPPPEVAVASSTPEPPPPTTAPPSTAEPPSAAEASAPIEPTLSPPVRNSASAAPPAGARYVVQVGVFAQAANARAAWSKLREAGLAARMDPLRQDTLWRVRVGPFSNAAEAERVVERVHAMGLPGTVVRLPASPRH